MISVYIGAAIDNSNTDPVDQFKALAELVNSAFPQGSGALIYNPLTAFINANKLRSPSSNKYVVEVNNHALLSADLAVFVWSNSPSFGVPLEIAIRSANNKPFIIYNKSKLRPGIYMEHSLGENDRIVDSEEALIERIKYLTTNTTKI